MNLSDRDEQDRHRVTLLAGRDGEPVFEEAWQAQILGLAFSLAEAGLFTRAQWSETLGAELAKAAQSGEADTQENYYLAAQRALETLIAAGAPDAMAALPQRIEQWRRAYLNTPHGQPVALSAGVGKNAD